jgi:G:T-mismatch repair DNA endonuclease (very short patch repair protein)/ribosomal protein L37AE/L43A
MSDKYSGLNCKKFNQVKTKCFWCGKEFLTPNYKTNTNNYNFCCKDCYYEYFRNIIVKSPEYIERNRQLMLNNLTNGSINKTNTTIQIAINQLLDESKIKYINEKQLEFYTVDNYLEDENLIIEVNGDYWHCNPNIFSKIENQKQYYRILRDKAKHTYVEKEYNISILYLWECDIRQNIELCRALIKEYIIKRGKLKNYDSYNYIIENGKLILQKNIIKPYMEFSKDELEKIVDKSIKERKEYYISFECNNCGKTSSQLISDYEQNDKHFCCDDCKFEYAKKRKMTHSKIFICPNCGKEFTKLDYQVKKGMHNYFCSKKCSQEYKQKRIYFNCEYCGKESWKIPGDYKKGKHHFCGRSCASKYYYEHKKESE